MVQLFAPNNNNFKITVGLRGKNRKFENCVGWKILQMMNLKMIEHTFPPLNIWWVRTRKISTKLQEECSFTHPTNSSNYI